MAGEKILVVDDEVKIVRVLKAYMEKLQSRMAELMNCTNCVMYSVPVTQMSQVFFDQVQHINLTSA